METGISYLSAQQIWFLGAALMIFVLASFFHLRQKYSLSLVLLVITGIILASMAALLDPFLNLWDERFHALVAKNMIDHPLMPTLYENPVIEADYGGWDRSVIWLHKQPLFLWQMTLSFALFGASEFTARLPDIVLMALMTVAFYRTGTLLVNRQTGFLAAALMISTHYFLELIAGRQMVDHNDFVFLAYVSASIWAWAEYNASGKKRWLILTGIFSGFAILCKWLSGLLVYSGWGMAILLKKPLKPSDFKSISQALLITVLIALPWQLLSFYWYPAEAAMEMQYNALHFSTVIEGHSGDWDYHFLQVKRIYGEGALWMILPAIVILFYRQKNRSLFISLLSITVVVYIFYTMAATKMPSFTIIAALPILLAFACAMDFILELIGKAIRLRPAVLFIFILIVSTIFIWRINLPEIAKKHSPSHPENHYSYIMTENARRFKELKLDSNTVIFNVPGRHYVECMFYTGLPSYGFVPNESQVKVMEEKGKKIAIFKSDQDLPFYLTAYPGVILLEPLAGGWN